jgi:hypothetical protein
MSKTEILRGARLGDLRKVLRARYGHTVPDDDAGREDLSELLLPVSLGKEPTLKMKNMIETWAKWMSPGDTTELIDRINRMPFCERLVNARRLGERMHIPNEMRERLKLKTIKPFDLTDKQLADRRRAKKRARDQRRRQAQGRKPREESLQQKKPWTTKGMSRATWYRRQAPKQEKRTCAKKQNSAHARTGNKTGAPVAGNGHGKTHPPHRATILRKLKSQTL